MISRRLYLSDNLINDVGRGTFSAVTRIGTIDLARNQLKKVDYQMFAQLNYIEVLLYEPKPRIYNFNTLYYFSDHRFS